MNIEKKSENKITTNENRHFLESNYVWVNRLFVLVYENQDSNSKTFRSWRHYLPKDIIKNYDIIVNGKNFFNQSLDSEIKQYNEIRKLTARQDEDDNAGCLWDYNCVKNHFRLIAVGLSKQKELDADPKAIQQIELLAKKLNADDADDNATDAGDNDQCLLF